MNQRWEVTWEGELPASPQAVWDTFTRHSGSYLWPIEYEPRVGGSESGLTQGGGTVTVWEPHRHFATRTRPEHERDGLNEIDIELEPLGDGVRSREEGLEDAGRSGRRHGAIVLVTAARGNAFTGAARRRRT
jgi:hypothetical protein